MLNWARIPSLSTTAHQPKHGYSDAELSRNRWHTAADWVEVFGPVVWDGLDAQLRKETDERVAQRKQQRAAGERTDDLMVIVIDSVPVFQRRERDRNAAHSTKQLYQVLVLSEVRWRRGANDKHARELGCMEPRLLLRYVEMLGLQGNFSTADEVIEAAVPNTDLAWSELLHWQRRSRIVRPRHSGAARRVNLSARVARPEGRVRPNRFAS